MEEFGHALADLMKTNPEVKAAFTKKIVELIESIKPEDLEDIIRDYLEGALDYAFENFHIEDVVKDVLKPRLVKALGGEVETKKKKKR